MKMYTFVGTESLYRQFNQRADHRSAEAWVRHVENSSVAHVEQHYPQAHSVILKWEERLREELLEDCHPLLAQIAMPELSGVYRGNLNLDMEHILICPSTFAVIAANVLQDYLEKIIGIRKVQVKVFSFSKENEESFDLSNLVSWVDSSLKEGDYLNFTGDMTYYPWVGKKGQSIIPLSKGFYSYSSKEFLSHPSVFIK